MQQTIDFQSNPSEETIRLGPLEVLFLITRESSGGLSEPVGLQTLPLLRAVLVLPVRVVADGIDQRSDP
jgi:hypothetical protein